MFCKSIKEKYKPFIQRKYPKGFEGYFVAKGKETRRICSNEVTTLEQGEDELNHWLVTYDRQMRMLRESLFSGYSVYSPRTRPAKY